MEIILGAPLGQSQSKKTQVQFKFPTQYDQGMLDAQIKQLGLLQRFEEGQKKGDRDEINYLINVVIKFPSKEQAEIHSRSNRLGICDINKQERYKSISSVGKTNIPLCRCCGFIQQKQELSLCQNGLDQIRGIGISTWHFFQTISNLCILLAIMFLVYSVYSMVTNIIASNQEVSGNLSGKVLNFLSISLGSKQLYSSEEKTKMYVIGAWIGLIMLAVWALVILGLKYYQKETQVKILLENKSVSEYTLVMQKMPTGYTIQKLQQQLNRYLQTLKSEEQIDIDKLEVLKYNEGRPFYFNQQQFEDDNLWMLTQKKQRYVELFKMWLLNRRYKNNFKKDQGYRIKKYKQYEAILIQKKKLINSLTSKIKEQYNNLNKQSKTTVFVTFATNIQKNFMLDRNVNDLITGFKNLLPFFNHSNRFTINYKNKTFYPIIQPAPDPEDVVWQNIGVKNCEKIARKIFTFSITLVLLSISFVIVYFLSTIQTRNEADKLFSLGISIVISVINLIIGEVLCVLTGYQRDYTMTKYQTSLVIKSVAAQLANSIINPIIANYFIKNNIYAENGLVQDVFILGLTNAFIPPLAKIINPLYFIKLIYAKWKSSSVNRLGLQQFQYNEICQNKEFQVGYQYIYTLNLFIFTCFFVSLQPILPFIAILGLISMYWAQKYNLYHRSQRPVPGTKILAMTISQMIYFGTIAFTLGSMTWANFMPNSEFKSALLPNIFALSLAFIIFITPYQSIFRRIFKNKRMPKIQYNDQRIYFTAEYDRLNPSTAEYGVQDFADFIIKKVLELQQSSPAQLARVSLELEQSNRPNFYKIPQTLHLTNSKGRQILNQIVRKQSQNSLTPQIIASVLTPIRPIAQSQIKAPKKQRMQTTQLRRYNSTIQPKNKEGSELILEQIKQKKPYEEIESVLEEIPYKQSRKSEEQNNLNELYLGDIQNIKSFVHRIKSTQRKEERDEKFSQTTPNSHLYKAPKKSRQGRQSLQVQKGLYESQLIKTSKQEEEGVNRFSINSASLMPLCIKLSRVFIEDPLRESDINFYQLGSFH